MGCKHKMMEFIYKQLLGKCPKCKTKLTEYGHSGEPLITKVKCDKCGWGQPKTYEEKWKK